MNSIIVQHFQSLTERSMSRTQHAWSNSQM